MKLSRFLAIGLFALSVAAQAACLPGDPACSAGAQGSALVPDARSMSPSLYSAQMQPQAVNAPGVQGMPVNAKTAKPARFACADAGKGNELQQYLCQSSSLALDVFGQNLFAEEGQTLAAPDSGAVAPDYVMGVGDSFALRIWGQLDANLPLTIDRSGSVFIPKVGNIAVVGVRFGDLKSHLANDIGKVFRNFDLAVTMGQLRSVRVFVVGFVKQPGSYAVSSLSTVVNALYAAGGPQAGGSLRQIELRRGGKVVSQFDLYDLFLKGDKSRDALLQAGDVVFVPSVGGQAAIHGAVKVPAIYEVKSGETLQDLLSLAGGASQYARGGSVGVERVQAGKRTVASVDLAQAASFAVQAGDVVLLASMTKQVGDGVSLKGAVAEAVRMPWKEGMRVSDLIPSRDALVLPDFWLGKSSVEKLDADKTQAMALRTQDSLVNWDYALIERLNEKDFSTTLIPFNLGRAVNDRDPAANLLLQKGDVLHVFNRSDIRVPSQKQTRVVRLEGEVAVPGVYQVAEGETLQQLIARIGGLTERAWLYGAEFNREAVRIKQQKELERLADYVEEAAQNFALTKAQNAISSTDSAAAQLQAEQQRKSAEKLRKLQASGRVVLGLKPDAAQVAELPALALEDGDRFFVPTRPATVQVIGSVFNRNSAFVHSSNRTVGDYLALSGGPTELGDAKSTFVMRADGSVTSAKQSGWFSSFNGLDALPGDAIIVPEKVDRTTLVKNMMDWSQILANFGLGAAAIKSLN